MRKLLHITPGYKLLHGWHVKHVTFHLLAQELANVLRLALDGRKYREDVDAPLGD